MKYVMYMHGYELIDIQITIVLRFPRHGKEWHGMKSQGKERHGMERHGKERHDRERK
jgi:hypothetical protein